MNFFILSSRNIWRHRFRTMSTVSAIAFGIFSFLTMDSLIQGMLNETVLNLQQYETAYAQVMTQEYFSRRRERPLDSLLSQEVVLDLENLSSGSARYSSSAELIFYKNDHYIEDGSLSLELVGLDLERDPAVFDLLQTIEEPSRDEWKVSLQEGGVLLSRFWAHRLSASVGMPLLISLRTPDGAMEVIESFVAGIFTSPNGQVNFSQFIMSLDFLDDYLFLQGKRSYFALGKKDEHAIFPLPAGTMVYSWEILASSILEASQADKMQNMIILFFLGIMAAVGVGNTMSMAVFERFSEIGTLRALGFKKNEIYRIFAWEGLLIGLWGALLGLLLSLGVIWYFVEWGIDLSSLVDGGAINIGYRTIGIMYGLWNWQTMLWVSLLAMFFSAFIAFWTARKAFQRSVVDCLYGS